MRECWIPLAVAVEQVGEGLERLLGLVVRRQMLTIMDKDSEPTRYREIPPIDNCQLSIIDCQLYVHINDLVAYVELREYDRAEAAGKTEMQADRICHQAGAAFRTACLRAAEEEPRGTRGARGEDSEIGGMEGEPEMAESRPLAPEAGGVRAEPVRPGAAGTESEKGERRAHPTMSACGVELRQDWGERSLPTLARERGKLLHGVPLVTQQEAAEFLGITLAQICHLEANGRLNYIQEGRKRWVLLDEVEAYARDQAHWQALAGRWTPFGRLPKRIGRRDDLQPERELPSHTLPAIEAAAPPAEEEHWVTGAYAAGLFGLSYVAARALMMRHGVRRKVEEPEGGVRRPGRPTYLYLLEDIEALVRLREREESRRSIAPGAWREGPTRKPFIRSALEAPPGDRLVTRVEAAAQLGVHVNTVTALVMKGILFGWQRIPGIHGCPLMLSERQVRRVANDPERIRRQQAQREGGLKDKRHEIAEANRDGWLEEVGLAGRGGGRRPWIERDFGEYFTVAQAARAMGVSRQTVYGFRARGRLRGYQKPVRKGEGNGCKWWFFRKDDVYALLADRSYNDYRARYRKGRGPVDEAKMLAQLDACVEAGRRNRLFEPDPVMSMLD